MFILWRELPQTNRFCSFKKENRAVEKRGMVELARSAVAERDER